MSQGRASRSLSKPRLLLRSMYGNDGETERLSEGLENEYVVADRSRNSNKNLAA